MNLNTALLGEADYQLYIRPQLLQQLVNGRIEVLLQAEAIALGKMQGILSPTFDVEQLFRGETPYIGEDPFLKSLLVKLSLYELYQSVSPDQIDQVMNEGYKEAIKTLEQGRDGKQQFTWPRANNKPDGGEATGILFHSQNRDSYSY